MSTSRFRAAGLVLATAAACFVPALLRAQEEGEGLIPRGDAPGLFLLYSGDVIGYIEPCG